MPPPQEPIDNAMFEALFVIALDVSGELEAELKRLGYDRRAPRARYPGAVLVGCIEAARRALHGEKPPAEGLRALGSAFVAGFQKTIVGRVVTAALPVLGPKMFLPRIPGRLKSVRSDVDVAIALTGPGSATLTFADPLPLGDFFAGVLTAALGVAGAAAPQVTVAARPGGYLLELKW